MQVTLLQAATFTQYLWCLGTTSPLLVTLALWGKHCNSVAEFCVRSDPHKAQRKSVAAV